MKPQTDKPKNGNWRKGGNKSRQAQSHPWRRPIFPNALKSGKYVIHEH